MKIVYVSSEIFPFSKTGGLADVAGSLPKRLAEAGCTIKIFSPKYYQVDERKFELQYCHDIGELLIKAADHLRPVHVYRSSVKTGKKDVEVYFIDCPYYFYRNSIYTNDPDENERFILFSKAVIESLQRLQWSPDIIHCNDWQAGLFPLYIKDNYSRDGMFDNTATLFTIHNIEYQGRFDASTVLKAEIKIPYFFPGGPVEFYGDFSFLKAGIVFSDLINTVSKTYAQEILTPEYGAGLDGVLKDRKPDLFGIINGVDYNEWDPEKDAHTRYHFSSSDLKGKLKNKKFLLDRFSLPYIKDIPLIGIVSRLAGQKGFDIISEAFSSLMKLDAQWIILGSGEAKYEDLFLEMAKKYPEKAAVYIGFNNELSHLIEAGADIFLMPSRYEPCGLNQIYSLKYGTVPVVRKTGGLADTVKDWDEALAKGERTGTGFSFSKYDPVELLGTLERALERFKDKKTWQEIQVNGMNKEYSWERAAKEYLVLYKNAVAKRKQGLRI